MLFFYEYVVCNSRRSENKSIVFNLFGGRYITNRQRFIYFDNNNTFYFVCKIRCSEEVSSWPTIVFAVYK